MVLRDNRGFTLVEALIAIVILSLGILVVGAMQTNSIRANATAIARSQAHAVVLSFIEVLQQLPFDDDDSIPDNYVLDDKDGDDVDGLDDGKAAAGSTTPDPTQADYAVQEADFQEGGVFADTLGSVYSVNGNTLTDGRGWQYQVFWNVAEQSTSSGGATKVIRLFVYWTSPMGSNSSIITFLKFNNIVL